MLPEGICGAEAATLVGCTSMHEVCTLRHGHASEWHETDGGMRWKFGQMLPEEIQAEESLLQQFMNMSALARGLAEEASRMNALIDVALTWRDQEEGARDDDLLVQAIDHFMDNPPVVELPS